MAALDHIVRFAFYGCVGLILLVHFFPPITKSKFHDPIKSMVWGCILTLLACAFVYYVAGNPLRELALILHGRTVSGFVIDAWEDAEETDYGKTIWDHRAIYTYRLPDGRSFKGTAEGSGRLKEEFQDLTEPYPIEIEYLPDNPNISRVKGDGCATVTELLWRKIGLGGCILVGFCWIPVGLLWKGLKDLKRLYMNPEIRAPDE